jgi:aryl-alcohol dehydrogenase-like predicted oxidoreductase
MLPLSLAKGSDRNAGANLSSTSRIALGTAQFGLQYGVANIEGRVSFSSVREIMCLASANGINMLDTAVAYGDSEERIGLVGAEQFNIVTKLPRVPDDELKIRDFVYKQVSQSLLNLRTQSLYGLLLHSPLQLLGSSGALLYKALQELKEKNLVQKIGISVYAPSDLVGLIPRYSLDIIQIPYSLVDRRLQISGWLQRLKDQNVELHTRSCFLQGLLLFPHNKIPPQFQPWQHLWDRWASWLTAHQNISPLAACIKFPLSFPEIDRIVVGVDSMSHLIQIIEALRSTDEISFPDLQSDDELLINPTFWKL